MDEAQRSRKEKEETHLSFWADMAVISYRHRRDTAGKRNQKHIHTYTNIHVR